MPLPQEEIVEAARAILGGELGIIEGARRLSGLRTQFPSLNRDPDLLLFVGIDSETDHLPFGEKYRLLWEPAALSREDLKIRDAENYWRERAFTACRSLVERFENASGDQKSES